LNQNRVSGIAVKKLWSEIKDDLGSFSIQKDKTTFQLIEKKKISAFVINREKIIICGLRFVTSFIKERFSSLYIQSQFDDGNIIKKNTKILKISGDARIILSIERTILNFLQHLSSISTYTNEFVKKIQKNTKLLDTRKTTTGLRILEKYATKIGGAINHRMGLYDKILIKDNHIKLIGGISKTLKKVKKLKIKDFIIECDSPRQVKKCLSFGASYIILDNMSIKQIKECLIIKKEFSHKIQYEVSGCVNIDNVKLYANLGVDFISTSKITNSAKSVDIGLDII
jgi:nicotinate-nucleotide pyrophosphorylase (carboxylating)